MSEERKNLCRYGQAGWLAVGSLALNLFLIGVLVGPMIGPHRPQGPDLRGMTFAPQGFQSPTPPMADLPRGGPGFMLDRVSKSLPAGEAAKFRAIFDDEHRTMGERRDTMMKTRGKLASILKQEKPDMDSLRSALNEIRASGQGFHETMAHTMERIATELSPESRRKIADALEDGEKKGGAPLPPPLPSEGPMDEPPPVPPAAPDRGLAHP